MTTKEALEEEIQKHDNAYWNEQNPMITDQEYDALVQKLQQVAPDSPILMKVHAPVSGEGKKIHHIIPMLSLNKVYSVPELLEWCKKVSRGPSELFLIQPKYDGCSAELRESVLSTRGDGTVGENISQHTRILKVLQGGETIPATKFKGATRGEIVLAKSVFEHVKTKLTRKGGEQFKNSRNACAGILNRDENPDINVPLLTLIDFNEYSIKAELGQLPHLDWDGIIRNTQAQDYPTDGLVIKLADFKYAQSLGVTSHHKRSEIAFKFANPTGTTVLESITWSQGKEVLTPIGRVAPVEISGVTVQNVNLHNMKYIRDNDIHIGDTLIIERAGDVIPDVQKVIPGKKRELPIITQCPVCNGPVEYREPEVRCARSDCPGKLTNKLMDSVIRIGIERLGKPTLEKMIDVLGVGDLIDIFRLQKDQLLQLPGFAESSATNLHGEIQKVLKGGAYDWQILASLNLVGIGKTLSKILMEKFSLSHLVNMVETIPRGNLFSQLQEIDQVGRDRAAVLLSGIEINVGYIKELRELLPTKEVVKEAIRNDMIKVCFTGKFPKKKAFYYALLSGTKYKVVESVTKDLGLLIVADPSKNSSKQKKAEKLGVTVMAVDDLLDKIQNQGGD